MKPVQNPPHTTVLYFWEEAGLSLGGRVNPYGPLLAEPLRALGYGLEDARYDVSKEMLLHLREECSLLHLNWLAPFYASGSEAEAICRAGQFLDRLSFARSIGYRVVWTFHNTFPHGDRNRDLDLMVRLYVAQIADAIIAHCAYAADQCKRLFRPRGEVAVIPHGNYIGVYPDRVPMSEARQRFDINNDAFVYGYVGNVRGYKGVGSLLDAFSSVRDADARLLLLLRCQEPERRGRLRRGVSSIKRRLLRREHYLPLRAMDVAARDGRVRVSMQPWIENDAYQHFYNACDAVALPFTRVLTSGSTMLALSFGKPVVVPRVGCLPELVDDSMAVLYDAESPDGLAQALLEMRNRDVVAAGRAALARAESFDWGAIGEKTAALYREVMAARQAR